MSTVVVTSRSFSTGSVDLVARLAAEGHQVVRLGAGHDLEEMRPHLATAAGWVAGTGPVTGAHLAAAPGLKVLARYGVGYDAVDLAAAAQAGVVVTYTPGANSDAVAEHAIGLMLATLRSLTAADRRVRAGDWASVSPGRELGMLTVGIVGFGRIGREVARRLRAFGSRVLAHDPFVREADEAVELVDLDVLARSADLVTLHLPGGKPVVHREWLDAAKPGQVVVNTARADLVDEEAVAQALESGRLGGFAADTLSTETGEAGSPVLSPGHADRVVVTPHIGGQTVQAIDRMGSMAVDDVLAVLAGRPPAHPVPAQEER